MEDERVRELNPHLFSGLLFLYLKRFEIWINGWQTPQLYISIWNTCYILSITHNGWIILLAVRRDEIKQKWQRPKNLQPNIKKGRRDCSQVVQNTPPVRGQAEPSGPGDSLCSVVTAQICSYKAPQNVLTENALFRPLWMLWTEVLYVLQLFATKPGLQYFRYSCSCFSAL